MSIVEERLGCLLFNLDPKTQIEYLVLVGIGKEQPVYEFHYSDHPTNQMHGTAAYITSNIIYNLMKKSVDIDAADIQSAPMFVFGHTEHSADSIQKVVRYQCRAVKIGIECDQLLDMFEQGNELSSVVISELPAMVSGIKLIPLTELVIDGVFSEKTLSEQALSEKTFQCLHIYFDACYQTCHPRRVTQCKSHYQPEPLNIITIEYDSFDWKLKLWFCDKQQIRDRKVQPYIYHHNLLFTAPHGQSVSEDKMLAFIKNSFGITPKKVADNLWEMGTDDSIHLIMDDFCSLFDNYRGHSTLMDGDIKIEYNPFMY